MVIDFINNIGASVAFVFLLTLMLQKQESFGNYEKKHKVIIGLGGGLLGIFLMLSTVEVAEWVIVDLRHLALVISAVYGGMIASAVTGLIIGLARFFLFGISAASTSALTIALVMGLFLGWISNLRMVFVKKYFIMNASYLAASSLAIAYFVNNLSHSVKILSYYLGISAMAGLLIYYLLMYIQDNEKDKDKILYYKYMINSMIDMISTHDQKGNFKYVSPSFKKITGYEKEELIGQSSFDFYHPDDLESLSKSLHAVINEDYEVTVQYRFRKKDGNYLWIETLAKKADLRISDEEEIIAASRDVTIRKELESQLLNLNNKLEELSNLDGLTGLHNRRSFDYKIEEEWNRAKRQKNELSILFIDIDDFKIFNDSYGHQEGDLCLQKIAEILMLSLKRTSDYVARYGGEEFVVILPETDQEGAIEIGERIRKAVEDLSISNERSETKAVITVSLGAATKVPNHENSFLNLINKADQALYRAKKSGKNRVVHYNEK